ncbi:MAG: hypothetical protein JO013_04790 [Alphaproteobacteria bacterium]|nr:hypothetical protein [Alphaproteobacteria bacterium]
MNQPLPAPAEAWLGALTRELWPLASDERAAVIAELRGHLAARAEAGLLGQTLADLGSPKALAAAYDLPGRSEGPIAAVPAALAECGKPVRQLLGDARATLRASRNGLPLVGAVLVTTLTATDFLLWLASRLPWVGVQVGPVMALRVTAVLLAFSAAYRLALSPRERAWSVDRGFLGFAAALAVASLVAMAAALVAARAAAALGGAEAVRRVVALVMLVLGSIALLRLQPWLAALAARRQGFGIAAAWCGTRGKTATIVGAWATLVLPLYLLHALLNLLALRVLPFGAGTLALAGLDAMISALIVVGAAMLNAAALRWLLSEPVPAPSPFATDPPPPELVDAARARLDRLLRFQPVRAA